MVTKVHARAIRVVLKRRTEVAERTIEVAFDRPDGLTFKAGQYMDVTLLHPPETDAEGNTRSFSIASSPDEAELRIATRVRDIAFKRVLSTMPLGTELKMDGPHGTFTLHRDAHRPAVFLAGGIGITPFRSMIHWAVHQHLSHRIYLFYSNRRPEDAPFLEEFRGLTRDSSTFTMVPTMTQMSRSSQEWKGETGYLTYELLSRHLRQELETPAQGSSARKPLYYIAGPPPMVEAFQSMLLRAGIDEEDLRVEEFSGY
jgi:ferredoxin-NADP reductase